MSKQIRPNTIQTIVSKIKDFKKNNPTATFTELYANITHSQYFEKLPDHEKYNIWENLKIKEAIDMAVSTIKDKENKELIGETNQDGTPENIQELMAQGIGTSNDEQNKDQEKGNKQNAENVITIEENDIKPVNENQSEDTDTGKIFILSDNKSHTLDEDNIKIKLKTKEISVNPSFIDRMKPLILDFISNDSDIMSLIANESENLSEMFSALEIGLVALSEENKYDYMSLVEDLFDWITDDLYEKEIRKNVMMDKYTLNAIIPDFKYNKTYLQFISGLLQKDKYKQDILSCVNMLISAKYNKKTELYLTKFMCDSFKKNIYIAAHLMNVEFKDVPNYLIRSVQVSTPENNPDIDNIKSEALKYFNIKEYTRPKFSSMDGILEAQRMLRGHAV